MLIWDGLLLFWDNDRKMISAEVAGRIKARRAESRNFRRKFRGSGAAAAQIPKGICAPPPALGQLPKKERPRWIGRQKLIGRAKKIIHCSN